MQANCEAVQGGVSRSRPVASTETQGSNQPRTLLSLDEKRGHVIWPEPAKLDLGWLSRGSGYQIPKEI
jgi:hypothetical protein